MANEWWCLVLSWAILAVHIIQTLDIIIQSENKRPKSNRRTRKEQRRGKKRRERIEYHVAHPIAEHTQSIHSLQTFVRFKYEQSRAFGTCVHVLELLFTIFRSLLRCDPLVFGIIIRIFDVMRTQDKTFIFRLPL